MYTAFYGLREKPFELSPDPRFLFLAESHREALAHLLFGIEQGQGFIAVTGEVGTGKTTLCRTLLQRLDPGAEVAILFNPQLSADELLEAVHVEFGLAGSGSRRELMERLNRFLLEKKGDGRRVLLIVDEAQTLGPDALELIRMLSNLETETSKLIQIILLGQPEFDAMLESPSLRQLRQRISVRWRLSPLGPAETAEYVRHRLRIAAGARRDVFSEGALRELHRRSGGIPRVVNLLCDRALLAGYAAGATTISRSLVAQADQELRGGARSPSLASRAKPYALRLRHFAPWAGMLAVGVLAGVLLQALLERDAPPESEAAVGPSAAASSGSDSTQPFAVELDSALVLHRPGVPSAAAGEIGPVEPTPASAPSREGRTAAGASGEPAVAGAAQLDRLLAASDPAVGMAVALDAVLDAWGLARARARSLTLRAAIAELRARGLVVLAVEPADVGFLAGLGHLALLPLRAPDGGERQVLLEAVGLESVRLVGLRDDTTRVEAVRGDVDARLMGVAHVVWRDFEGLPPVLRWGFRGPAVEWLQSSLQRLGYLESPPSGEYDGPTVAAVRAFQADRGLSVDGEVGPRTKMALYAALEAYPTPRLVTGPEEVG